MTTEEKFNAAVNVIRNLPKNGSYQPSHDLMLKFYGLFKQATLGPCQGSRPAFWDIVGRAKYDAHKNLGKMSKQEAMKRYVDELHQIVETMSYSDTVANFLQAPSDEIESLNMDDLELVAGDVMKRIRSQSNSPLISRETSPARSNASNRSSGNNAEFSDQDYSDDEFIDSVEVPEYTRTLLNNAVLPNGPSTCVGNSFSNKYETPCSTNISREINSAVESMKTDIEQLKNKLQMLENSHKVTPTSNFNRIEFINLSPQLLAFVLLWPFLASLILHRFVNRK